MTNAILNHRWLLVILLAFALLGIFRVNDLSLYTDSTRYLIWGTSLAQGNGWLDDTQPEPERYVINAPLYPVVLAPALLAFPMSLTAAKLWTVAWAVLGLALFAFWLAPRLGRLGALLGVFMLAFNPMTVVLSSEVLSEAPFLTFTMTIFVLMERLPEEEKSAGWRFWIMVACFATVVLLREVAVTLVAAGVLSLLLRKRPKEALIILGSALVVYAIWLYRNLVLVGTPPTSQSTNLRFIFEHVVTSPEAPLAQELISRVWLSLKGFAFQLAGMLLYSVPTTLIITPSGLFKATVNLLGWSKYLVFLVTVPLFLAGAWLDLRSSATAAFRLLLFVFYLVIILTYPIHDFRFLFPILPLMIFYLLLAARRAWTSLPDTRRTSVRWVPAAVVLTAMIPNYLCLEEILSTNLSYRNDPIAFHRRTSGPQNSRTYFSEPWTLMGDWIRQNTPDSCVIVCSAKEISTFIGARKILEINDGVPRPLFEALVRDNAAEYVLSVGLWGDVTSYDFILSESALFSFEPLRTIANLHLFRVHSRLMTPPARRTGWTRQWDLNTPAGLLRKGRWELTHEEYDSARQSLARAAAMMPGQPAILFQDLLVNTFQEDSAAAVRSLESMFATSRATPYIWAARTHVEAMNSLLQARRMRVAQQRAVAMFDIARLYWNVGYEPQAYRLARDVIRQDSGYFVGLLWGWNYAMRSMDTSSGRAILRILERIDAGNAVVRAFRIAQTTADSLRRTSVPRERALLRLHIAQQYHAIELPDEAMDETERCIAEDSTFADAWLFYGRLFEQRGKQVPALRAYRHVSALGHAAAGPPSRLSR